MRLVRQRGDVCGGSLEYRAGILKTNMNTLTLTSLWFTLISYCGEENKVPLSCKLSHVSFYVNADDGVGPDKLWSYV
jgi:hypothetical protein